MLTLDISIIGDKEDDDPSSNFEAINSIRCRQMLEV